MVFLLSCFDFDLFQIIPENVSGTNWPRNRELTFPSPSCWLSWLWHKSWEEPGRMAAHGLVYCVNIWRGKIVQESLTYKNSRIKGENQNRRDKMNRKGTFIPTLSEAGSHKTEKLEFKTIISNETETNMRKSEDHSDTILLPGRTD